jgi:hypothetical protein
MRVSIVLEFEDVDPESDEGVAIMQSIAEGYETIQIAFDATSCYVKYDNNLEE